MTPGPEHSPMNSDSFMAGTSVISAWDDGGMYLWIGLILIIYIYIYIYMYMILIYIYMVSDGEADV